MKKLLLNNKFIGFVIILNTIILFLDGFESIENKYPIFFQLDLFINLIFIFEMLVKIKTYGWKIYIDNNWNRIDFVINIFLIYMFFTSFSENNLSLIIIFRTLRIFKFLKFIKYVPNVSHLMKGVKRGLKASLFVFLLFFIYLLTISFISCFLFKVVAPEYFGNPLISIYTSFKLFSVEGWDVISDNVADHFVSYKFYLTKFYFMLIVLTGGLFGLSIVNAIFVDEMVSDNNDELERKLDYLIEEIKELKESKK